MNIEEQARREAEERYPAARVMHFSGDGPVLDVGAIRLNREAYAAALISERSKERPWIHEIIAAAIECFDLGPEDQDAVLRFGMKLQDMHVAERKAQPSVEEVMEAIMQWLSERSSLTGEIRDRLTTLLNTSAAMADIERCQQRAKDVDLDAIEWHSDECMEQ